MKRNILIILILSCVTSVCRSEVISAESLYRKWRSLPADSLMSLGRKCDERNSPDSALVCYTIITDRFADASRRKDSESKIYARALNNLAYLYSVYYFDYGKSLSLLQKAADLSRSIGYDDNLAYTYMNIGGLYLECNLLYGSNLFIDQIWENLESGLSLAIHTGKWHAALGCMVNICSMTLKTPDSARFNKALDMLHGHTIDPDTYLYAYTMDFTSGVEHVLRHDYDRAIQDFTHMAEGINPDDMQAPLLGVTALSAIADVYAMKGDWQGAISTTLRMIDEANEANVRPEMAIGYRNLAHFYEMASDTSSSRSSLFKYYNLKDSLLTAAELTQLGSMPLMGELDRINEKMRQEEARRRRIITIFIVTGVCLLVLAAYMVLLLRSNIRLKAYARQIYLKNVELMESESRERERRMELQEAHAAASEQKVRYAGNILSDETGNEILEKINAVMNESTAAFDAGFSLQQLAELTGYNYKQVSQVINDRLDKNFKTLLADIRIREACRRLMDIDNYGDFTIEHIGKSVGFVSRSNFSVTFKTIIGISPSEFQKNARADYMAEAKNRSETGTHRSES